MVRIIGFADALRESAEAKRHLLIGNGFSIALFPARFRYESLLNAADFEEIPEARLVFEALNTVDFVVAINALRTSASLSPIYGASGDIRKECQRTQNRSSSF